LIIENYTDTVKEALAAYDATMWADLFPATSDFPLSPFGAAWQIEIPTDSEINVLMTWVQSTWLPGELAKIVTTSPDNFEAQWAESQQKLVDGDVLKLNEMFTELVKAKAAAWGN
jgi:putative aldouronate transport system substrate-binding protein